MMSKTKRKIILDTDVISHFIKGEQIALLPRIFPHALVVLDIVLRELSRHPRFQPFTIGLVRFGLVAVPRHLHNVLIGNSAQQTK